MAPRRLETLSESVFIEVDGDAVLARFGEPLAVALTAAGRLTLGRSVKYHRPRGAACYAGRCDGCLMRVDGVQSVTTCRRPVRHSMKVETQNVMGSARRDLLSATDWFFPGGMNHHEMFTWNEQINKVMQKIARRIAGIGTLPNHVEEPRPVREVQVDVLVIGAGPAGLSAAATLAEGGRSVWLIDEEPGLGGSLRYWPTLHDPRLADELARRGGALRQRVEDAGVQSHCDASVVGIYEPWEDVGGAPAEVERPRTEPVVAAASIEGALVRVRPRQVVIATGRGESASAFRGADRPGVVSLHAAALLLSYGVLVGERVVLAGEGPLLWPLHGALGAAGAEVHGPFAEAALVEAHGRPTVEGCDVLRDGRTGTLDCDAVAIGTPTSAVYELAAQAGVEVRFEDGRYNLIASEVDGETAARDVRVAGGAAGVTDLDAAIEQARRVAEAMLR